VFLSVVEALRRIRAFLRIIKLHLEVILSIPFHQMKFCIRTHRIEQFDRFNSIVEITDRGGVELR